MGTGALLAGFVAMRRAVTPVTMIAVSAWLTVEVAPEKG
jgi:hypothetical protein